MRTPYSILSLCTGIGALDIAVRRSLAKKGIETRYTAFAEPDPECAQVLKFHHPEVINLGDIKLVDDWLPYKSDVIVAGFPCQPFSRAGNMLGENDERYLWPFIDEAICTIRPRLVFLENVAGFRSQGFGKVGASLARNGYVFRWHSVRASDIGAPHRRDRVFIAAKPASDSGSQ